MKISNIQQSSVNGSPAIQFDVTFIDYSQTIPATVKTPAQIAQDKIEIASLEGFKL